MTKKLNDSQDDNENLISIDDLVEDSSSSDYGVELSAESWTVSAKTNKLGTIEQPSRVRSSLDDESDEMKQLLEAAEAGSSERARPQETSSTPNIKPATAKLEPSKEVQKILEELNRLEQLEEQKQQKTKQARVVVNSSAPTVKLKLPETKPPEGEQADTDFNKTLAELNFNEAQELLSRGDRGSAINRLKTAIGYDSKNISYLLKLASVLAEDPASKIEAEQLLSKAVELDPNNMDLRSKLSELQNRSKREQGTKKLSVEELPKPALTKPLVTKPAQQKAGKPKFVSASTKERPSKISGRDLAIVIGAIVLSALLFLITSRRGPIPADVTLLSPADSASLLSSRVELSWSCTAPNFKLLIEEGSSIVLEKSLKEQNYILSEEELQLLKPGNTYTWRVIPYDTMGKELPHEERLAHFNLISPPPPPAPIKAPSYANSPTITIRRGTTGAD